MYGVRRPTEPGLLVRAPPTSWPRRLDAGDAGDLTGSADVEGRDEPGAMAAGPAAAGNQTVAADRRAVERA